MVIEHKPLIELILFLGDDMVMLCNKTLNVHNLRKNIAAKFNMMSKEN